MSMTSRGSNLKKSLPTSLFCLLIVINYAKATIDYAALRSDIKISQEVIRQTPKTTRSVLEELMQRKVTSGDHLQHGTEHLLHYGAFLRTQILDKFGMLVYDHYDDFGMSQIEALYKIYRETLERKYNIFDIVPSILNEPEIRPTKICAHINDHVKSHLKESSKVCMNLKINDDEPHEETFSKPALNVTRKIYKLFQISTFYPHGFSPAAVLKYLRSGRLRFTPALFSGLLHNVQYDSFDDKVRRAERELVLFLTNTSRKFSKETEKVSAKARFLSELLMNFLTRGDKILSEKASRHATYLAKHVIREVDAVSENIEWLGTTYDNSTINLKYLFELILPNDTMDDDIVDARNYLLHQMKDQKIVEKYLSIEKYQQTGPDQLFMEILGQLRDIDFAEDLVTSLYTHARFWHKSHMIESMDELLELFDAYENLRRVPEYRELLKIADGIKSDLEYSKNVSIELLCSRPRTCLRIGLEMVRNCTAIDEKTKKAIDVFIKANCQCSCLTVNLSIAIENYKEVGQKINESKGKSSTPLGTKILGDIFQMIDSTTIASRKNLVKQTQQPLEINSSNDDDEKLDRSGNDEETSTKTILPILDTFYEMKLDDSTNITSDSLTVQSCLGHVCSTLKCNESDCQLQKNSNNTQCEGSNCNKTHCEGSECVQTNCKEGNCTIGSDEVDSSECNSCKGDDCKKNSRSQSDCENSTISCEGNNCQDNFVPDSGNRPACNGFRCDDNITTENTCKGSECEDNNTALSMCEGPDCDDDMKGDKTVSTEKIPCLGLDCLPKPCVGNDCKDNLQSEETDSTTPCEIPDCSSVESLEHCKGSDCSTEPEVECREDDCSKEPKEVECQTLDCKDSGILSKSEESGCKGTNCSSKDCKGSGCSTEPEVECKEDDCSKEPKEVECQTLDCKDSGILSKSEESGCEGTNCSSKDCKGSGCSTEPEVECKEDDCSKEPKEVECQTLDCKDSGILSKSEESGCKGTNCSNKDCKGSGCSTEPEVECKEDDCSKEPKEVECQTLDCKDSGILSKSEESGCEGTNCSSKDCKGQDCLPKGVVDCKGPNCRPTNCTGPICREQSTIECEGPECSDKNCTGSDCAEENRTACKGFDCSDNNCTGSDCAEEIRTACKGFDCSDNNCTGSDCAEENRTACKGLDCSDNNCTRSDCTEENRTACEGLDCSNNNCTALNCPEDVTMTECKSSDCLHNANGNCFGSDCPKINCTGPDCLEDTWNTNCTSSDCPDNLFETMCLDSNCSSGMINNTCSGTNCPLKTSVKELCMSSDCSTETSHKNCDGPNCSPASSEDKSICNDDNCSNYSCEGGSCDEISSEKLQSNNSAEDQNGANCEDENCEIDTTKLCQGSNCPAQLTLAPENYITEQPCIVDNCTTGHNLTTEDNCEGANCTKANLRNEESNEVGKEKNCDGEDCEKNGTKLCQGDGCIDKLPENENNTIMMASCNTENCTSSTLSPNEEKEQFEVVTESSVKSATVGTSAVKRATIFCGNRDPYYRRHRNRLRKMQRIDALTSNPKYQNWNYIISHSAIKTNSKKESKISNNNVNENSNVNVNRVKMIDGKLDRNDPKKNALLQVLENFKFTSRNLKIGKNNGRKNAQLNEKDNEAIKISENKEKSLSLNGTEIVIKNVKENNSDHLAIEKIGEEKNSRKIVRQNKIKLKDVNENLTFEQTDSEASDLDESHELRRDKYKLEKEMEKNDRERLNLRSQKKVAAKKGKIIDEKKNDVEIEGENKTMEEDSKSVDKSAVKNGTKNINDHEVSENKKKKKLKTSWKKSGSKASRKHKKNTAIKKSTEEEKNNDETREAIEAKLTKYTKSTRRIFDKSVANDKSSEKRRNEKIKTKSHNFRNKINKNQRITFIKSTHKQDNNKSLSNDEISDEEKLEVEKQANSSGSQKRWKKIQRGIFSKFTIKPANAEKAKDKKFQKEIHKNASSKHQEKQTEKKIQDHSKNLQNEGKILETQNTQKSTMKKTSKEDKNLKKNTKLKFKNRWNELQSKNFTKMIKQPEENASQSHEHVNLEEIISQQEILKSKSKMSHNSKKKPNQWVEKRRVKKKQKSRGEKMRKKKILKTEELRTYQAEPTDLKIPDNNELSKHIIKNQNREKKIGTSEKLAETYQRNIQNVESSILNHEII